jgi:hypothetical protein
MIEAAADERRLSEDQLKRAKKKLGLKARREGFGTGSVWLWAFPGDKRGTQDDLLAASCGCLRWRYRNQDSISWRRLSFGRGRAAAESAGRSIGALDRHTNRPDEKHFLRTSKRPWSLSMVSTFSTTGCRRGLRNSFRSRRGASADCSSRRVGSRPRHRGSDWAMAVWEPMTSVGTRHPDRAESQLGCH